MITVDSHISASMRSRSAPLNYQAALKKLLREDKRPRDRAYSEAAKFAESNGDNKTAIELYERGRQYYSAVDLAMRTPVCKDKAVGIATRGIAYCNAKGDSFGAIDLAKRIEDAELLKGLTINKANELRRKKKFTESRGSG